MFALTAGARRLAMAPLIGAAVCVTPARWFAAAAPARWDDFTIRPTSAPTALFGPASAHYHRDAFGECAF
jgi:hypothetical protein